MAKKMMASVFVLSVLCLMMSVVSNAAESKTAGEKAKSFWQKLFNYPANVTNETAGVVTDAVKDTTAVVTKEVKTVGEVTSGSLGKTKDLVTEPLVGTAQATKKAVENTAAIPVKANKEETK